MFQNFFLLLLVTLSFTQCQAQKTASVNQTTAMNNVQPAAERTDQYLPLLKGKKVAVFANQTSTVGNKHLVDVLKENGVTIKVIFGPEHGFRGTADAGEKVESTIDKSTGVPVVSLYGKKRVPSKEDLEGVDVILFDI